MLGDISLLNWYLRALSKNEGYMKIRASASNHASTEVKASQLAVS
jgi:hypothetical protein